MPLPASAAVTVPLFCQAGPGGRQEHGTGRPGPRVAWRGYTSSSSPAGGLPIGQVRFYPAG